MDIDVFAKTSCNFSLMCIKYKDSFYFKGGSYETHFFYFPIYQKA